MVRLLIPITLFLIVTMMYGQTGPGGIGNSSNNKLWLRSDLGVTLNGSAVSTWADQSGNGEDVTQGNASNQPLFVTNELNGHPVIRFDGTNDCLVNSAFSLHLEPNGHVYVIFKTSTSQNGTYMVSFPEGLLGGNGFDVGFSTTEVLTNVRTTALFTSQASATLTYDNDTPRLAHALFNAGLSLGEHQLYIDGTQEDLANNSGPLITNVIQQLFVGCFSETFGAFYEGDIVEIIVFNSALGAAERTILDNYLAARYNISISNSRYSSSTFTKDVAGIGREGGAVYGEASSAGLTMIANGALNDDGDYMFCGHNSDNNEVVTSDVPSGVARRWSRDWFIDKTGTLDGADLQIAFDFSEGGFGITPGPASEYRLLRRSTVSGAYSIVSTTSTDVVGDRVIFDVDEAELSDQNYYTLGATESDSPLPVSLAGFGGLINNDNTATIFWSTESEINNESFILERKTAEGEFQTIAVQPGQGNSNTRTNYSHVDLFVYPGNTYDYRLSDRDINGVITTHPVMTLNFPDEGPGDVVTSEETTSQLFELESNYPNPFNPKTFIRYQLFEAASVSLEILDPLGRIVKSLVNENQPQGSFVTEWDGLNETGAAVPSGVYYYRLIVNDRAATRKMLLLR